MNSKKAQSFIRLGRPVNMIITLLSIPVACWIAGGTMRQLFDIVAAALTGALVTAGANAINDFFDVEIDRINRPERPLPRGDLSPEDARTMWLVTSTAAVVLNVAVNPAALAIATAAVVLLYFYSARLKGTILAGNIVVGLMTGMAFIYGGVVVGNPGRAALPALFAFLINLARELVKDVEDMEGDRAKQASTLPVRYGPRSALAGATLSLVLLIGCTFFAALHSFYQPAFLYIVLVADLLMFGSILMIWRDSSPAQMRRASNTLKLSMGVGLLSIIAGSL
jgi:geranylgeranylglycerol-phosphate geranylgeranyltransferase